MQSLAASCETTAHLDSKARNLIALRVAVTARCYGCIGLHVEAAPKLGASQKRTSDALGVKIGLAAGDALAYSSRVLDCY